MNNNKPMFDSQLRPYYDGRVLANESAMRDPAVLAALANIQARNWEDQPSLSGGVWNISDRH
jgi:hypothetical protein|tara:strand:- start:1105 stop:1290 length:186 start_codon:yes stop_codon:yes gene_type:complete